MVVSEKIVDDFHFVPCLRGHGWAKTFLERHGVYSEVPRIDGRLEKDV
jgi:hypothetical protein